MISILQIKESASEAKNFASESSDGLLTMSKNKGADFLPFIPISFLCSLWAPEMQDLIPWAGKTTLEEGGQLHSSILENPMTE